MADLYLVDTRSEEHTSELQSPCNLVCRLLLEKKKSAKSHCRRALRRPCGGTSRVSPLRRTYQYPARVDATVGAASATPECRFVFFFFNDTATTEIYTLSLHDALPIYNFVIRRGSYGGCPRFSSPYTACIDRKSTRLNSSHLVISYAVFCLKKKKK